MTVIDQIVTAYKSGIGILCCNTTERRRYQGVCIDASVRLSESEETHVITWSVPFGFTGACLGEQGLAKESFTEAIRLISESPGEDGAEPTLPRRCIVIMFGTDEHLTANGNPICREALIMSCGENSCMQSQGIRRQIHLVQAHLPSHPELRRLMMPIDFPLPNADERLKIVSEKVLRTPPGKVTVSSHDVLTEIADSMKGADQAMASSSLQMAMYESGGINDAVPAVVRRNVTNTLKASIPGVTITNHEDLNDTEVIGFDVAKKVIHRLREAESPDGVRLKLVRPKGMLLAGHSGTGKTVFANWMCRTLGRTMVSVKIGDFMSKWQGESQSNVRELISLLRTYGSSVILWADEIDKGVAGGIESAKSDGGTRSDVIGSLMTYLGDRDPDRPFFIAAANGIVNMPALMRSGRISAIVPVPLPSETVRLGVYAMTMSRLGCTSPVKNAKIAAMTKDYSGADVVQLVETAQSISVLRTGTKVSEVVVTQADFVEAQKEIRTAKSENPEAFRKLEEYLKTLSPKEVVSQAEGGGDVMLN